MDACPGAAYLARRSLGWVGLQQLFDKLLGFRAHFLPVALVENDAAILALLDQIRKVL